MRKIIFITGSLLAIACFYASAQSPALVNVAAPPKVEETVIDFLEFRQVDIKDVLRQLSKQYGLNIIFSAAVTGPITVQLQNVTIDEALDVIVTINGFVYSKKGSVIKVTTPSEAEQEGRQTRVFRLNNADAASMASSLAKVMSGEGAIQVDARSNSLILTDIPRVIAQVEQMIVNLDSMTPQVLIEAKFIEATLGTTQKLGIDWSPINAKNPTLKLTGSKRPTSVPFNPVTSGETMRNFFPAANPSTVGTTTDSDFPSAFGMPYPDPALGATTSMFAYGALDFTNMQAAMNFIKNSSNAKVISSPRVVTLDNKQARIQIGETRRIATSYTVEPTTLVKTYSYEAADVGVILTVTPHVTPDGHIRLNLAPEVSSADKVDSTSGINIIEKRIVTTEVNIKDGQTVVIGGLIENRKTEAVSKIPFLGDIPLVGNFFKHTTTDPDSKVELLIFVTARVVREDEGQGKLVGYDSGIVTEQPRAYKMELREAGAK